MQTTSSILMIRPVNFAFNEQTAGSNAFQVRAAQEGTQEKALQEFDQLVELLIQNDVDVTVVTDTAEPATPDSIFPNNWISFHRDGTVYLYPMQAENRRLERRPEILDVVSRRFEISGLRDLSYFEQEAKFLEGTGSLVLDRDHKLAYACLSPRTNPEVLETFSSISGYEIISFNAVDEHRTPIYHTNVMMCIGSDFAVICLQAIPGETERNNVNEALLDSGKEVVEISFSQMNNFAGNMLHLENKSGESLLVMSERAYRSLTLHQITCLTAYARIIYVPIPTIENNGGGSARCMIAEIHLPLKNLNSNRK